MRVGAWEGRVLGFGFEGFIIGRIGWGGWMDGWGLRTCGGCVFEGGSGKDKGKERGRKGEQEDRRMGRCEDER